MKIYIDTRDWWIGWYRGDRFHYVCPLPAVVIRWARTPPGPVVHLYDPNRSDNFTECCGVNWLALIDRGILTANPDHVTCPGRNRD